METLKLTTRPNGRLLVSQYLINQGQSYRIVSFDDLAVRLTTHAGALLAESKDGILTVDSQMVDMLMTYRPEGYRMLCHIQATRDDGAVWSSAIEIRHVTR